MNRKRDKNRHKAVEFSHMDRVSDIDTRNRNLEIANAQLRDENAALRRQLERFEMYHQTDKAKAFSLDEQIDKLQQERDAWRDEVHRWYVQANASADKSTQLRNEYWKDAVEANNGNMSPLARGILWNLDASLRLADDTFKSEFGDRSIVQHGKPLSDDIELAVASLARLGVVIGVNQLAMRMANNAKLMSQNPYMVCCGIMLELRTTGDVPIELLTELPRTWIDDNLRCKKLETLQEALRIAHKVEQSSIREVATVDRDAPSPRTIEHYRKDYNTIREMAKNPPEWVKTILDFDPDPPV